MQDSDRWRVLYRDGETILDEDGPLLDGSQSLVWADVDPVQVALIQLREGEGIVASVLIPSDASPVLFRRRQIAIQMTPDAPEETGRSTVTVIGWSRSDGTAAWLWRAPDGTVALTAGDIQG
jgi:hypothetical protein